eukprot:EG_transcript_18473
MSPQLLLRNDDTVPEYYAAAASDGAAPATGRGGSSRAWPALLLAGLGLVLGLLSTTAVDAFHWTAPTHLGPLTSRPASTLFAAKGFGTSTPKRSGAKRSKPAEPEPYLSRPVPTPETPPKPKADLPIEEMPTTVYDYFNPGEPDKVEVDPGIVEGLEILKFPDPRLRVRSTEIAEENILSGEVEQISRKMFEMMYSSNGIGLAAPQLGINRRLMVFNPAGDRRKWQLEQVLINPEIIDYSSRIIPAPEGCLSFPKVPKVKLPFQKPTTFEGRVWRPDEITVRATNLKGRRSTFKYSGWTARIFQHEYDHLDGICWIDRLEDDERQRVQPFVKDLIAAYGDGGAIAPL